MKIENHKNVPTITPPKADVGIPTVALGKYFIKVYGCQHNEWDGARIDFMLRKIGLIPSSEKEADIIFVLSCSVRQTAVDRILGKIRIWAGKKVIITGCVLEKDKKKYEERGALVWDIEKPDELYSILSDRHSERSEESSEACGLRPRSFANTQDDELNIRKILAEGNSNSAYLPIMIGCNNFCSYCAVPYTRGREKSRPIEEIVKDFKKIVAKGHKEIMLLGQNVNSYKNDNSKLKSQNFNSKYSNCFAQLLELLNGIPGDFKIRFTSNHPKDMCEEIIQAIATLPKIEKEIHLPLQSGSNKILKAMNRPYTKEQYLKLVKKIKKEIPNVRITTDVIVGFPGETEADFQETVEVYEKVGYFQSFTNKYSPRAGTAAYKLGDPISWKEKQRRWGILNETVNNKPTK